jgi:hypothetical protein
MTPAPKWGFMISIVLFKLDKSLVFYNKLRLAPPFGVLGVKVSNLNLSH